MSDIEVVIKIDEDTYKDIKKGKIYSSVRDVPQESVLAIANGTPLRKGHGPLIDVNELEPDTEWSYYEDDYTSYSRNQIESAEVVVEADDPEEKEDL